MPLTSPRMSGDDPIANIKSLEDMREKPTRIRADFSNGGLILPPSSPYTAYGNMAKNLHARAAQDQARAPRDAGPGGAQHAARIQAPRIKAKDTGQVDCETLFAPKNCPSGKSANPCPAFLGKIFRFPVWPNHLSIPRIPPNRGAFRDRHEREAGCGGHGSVDAQRMVAGRVTVSDRGARTNC